MADRTPIEWTDATWNPVTGCSVVSPGCTNCYAMRLAGTRMKHHPSRRGLTDDAKAGPVWNGQVRFNKEWLAAPLAWRKPRRIFVCAHGDLFHEAVPEDWIDRVFAVMALAPQHTFQVLTKRAARMRRYFEVAGSNDDPYAVHQRVLNAAYDLLSDNRAEEEATRLRDLCEASGSPLPLPNVWLGVSAEDQARADERIPDLLATPAAVRFISAEPLLGDIDLNFLAPLDGDKPRLLRPQRLNALTGARGEHGTTYYKPAGSARLDWVIAGGESGRGARPMHPDWARSLRDQCAAAGVSFFHKQNGEFASVSEVAGTGEHHHFPDGATVRRVGKKAAGRLLDGTEHSAFPRTQDGGTDADG